jgi:hypothetical protein
MSGPDGAKMSDKLKLPTNKQFTSWGESEKVRYKTLAQTWSKNGFMIQLKGVSPTCLLSGLEIVQPLDVRWKQNGGAPLFLVPNMYTDISDCLQGGARNNFNGMNAVLGFDSLQIRPNGLMRSARSATISYNGRSFSTRVNQYISGVERVFCDGGVEEVYGWPYATYPFTNLAHPARLQAEPGRFARAKELTSDSYLKGAYMHQNIYTDQVYSYNIRSKLFLGPFLGDAFPDMMKSLDDNTTGSLPYLSNLTVEIQYEQNPLIHWFCYPGNDLVNALSCQNPSGFPMDDAGTNVPDLDKMWTNIVTGDLRVTAENPPDARISEAIGLRQPYAEYTFVEQSPMLPIPPQVPIASKSFICYEDMQQITGGVGNLGQSSAKYSFSNIKINQISQLYMVYVEAADTTVAGAVGARAPKWAGGMNVQRLGGAYSVVFAPIDWGSVRILLSTKNQVLGNFSADKLGISERSQYEKFKKYSGNRAKMSFSQWRQSSQMILFSAQDLNLDVFSGMHDPLSLTIEFSAGRLATEASIPSRAFGTIGTVVPLLGTNYSQNTRSTNLVARLVMVQQEEIVLFDGGCEKKSVYWDPEVARRAAQQSLGRGETVADGPPKGALSGY